MIGNQKMSRVRLLNSSEMIIYHKYPSIATAMGPAFVLSKANTLRFDGFADSHTVRSWQITPSVFARATASVIKWKEEKIYVRF